MAKLIKRVRRTPEEAKRLILDAAEADMGSAGPAGIRLVQIAARAGVSHPTVLHHFGSREGLVKALNRRTLEGLKSGVIGTLRADQDADQDGVALTFRVYRDGLAQRLMWILQAEAGAPPVRLDIFEDIVQELHALRLRLAEPGVHIDESDTRSIIHLTAIAAFGDALIGPRLRSADDPQREIELRTNFERWLASLINNYIAAGLRAPT